MASWGREPGRVRRSKAARPQLWVRSPVLCAAATSLTCPSIL